MSTPAAIATASVPSKSPDAVARECGFVDVEATIAPEHIRLLVTVSLGFLSQKRLDSSHGHGSAPRIVFVHGSVMGGRPTWSGQRTLGERFELELLDRPGFPPNPPVDRVDFEEHAVFVAEAIRGGAHLVGHSYGGVIALLAAAAVPDRVRSLTVIEPPATAVARGNEAVEGSRGRDRMVADGPTDDPEAFLRGFLGHIGSDYVPPSPLPAQLEQGVLALIAERGPWEAEIPLETSPRTPFPKLVVSGGHHAGFDAVCDVLVERLGAELLVLPGYGHMPQRHPDFNERLTAFVADADARPVV